MKQILSTNYIRLSIMMFLQFMLFAVWWVPLAAYLTNLGVSDIQKALILSSMAIGCIASPIVGGVADRYFSGEKVLAGLNFITSLLLVIAGFQSNPNILFILFFRKWKNPKQRRGDFYYTSKKHLSNIFR